MLPVIVALIVGISLGAYLIELLDDLGEQMGKDVHTVYSWARRSVDPLPLRYEMGTRRSGCIDVAEGTQLYLRSAQAASASFTNTGEGLIKAIRISA